MGELDATVVDTMTSPPVLRICTEDDEVTQFLPGYLAWFIFSLML